MKVRYLVFIFLSTLSLFGQQQERFQLNWKLVYEPVLEQQVLIGEHTDFEPNGGYSFTYSKKIKKNQNLLSYKIENLRTVPLRQEELATVPFSKKNQAFSSDVNIVKAGSENWLRMQITPVYKNSKGAYVKVLSFDVNYNLGETTNRTSRVTAVNGTIKNSVLHTGTWYKIAVDKTGVFKMDANFLRSLGINTNAINPKHIRVFGNGVGMLPESLSKTRAVDLVENAIQVVGEADNVFDNNDYVLFYAKGPNQWEYVDRENSRHLQNVFSTRAHYFINVDSGINGKRIQTQSTVTQAATKQIQTFTDFQFHERELINYIRVGKTWFGEDFSVNNSQSFTFQFPNIDTSVPVLVKGAFSAKSRINTNYQLFYDDQDGVESNNPLVLNTAIQRISALEYNENSSRGSFTPTTNNIKLDIVYQNGGDLSALAYMDYIEVVADRLLQATGTQFGFVNFDSSLLAETLEYTIGNESEIDAVWDVTDIAAIKRIQNTTTGNNFRFKEVTDGKLNHYHIVKNSDAYTPISLGNNSIVANQNLHALSDIQYLIVTTNALKPQAERLANYHRTHTQISETNSEFLNVAVVGVEEVYNEFSSGSKDITAIRDFAKYLYDNGTTEEKKLKYLCLFGDASFDYKGIEYPETDLVPVYLSSRGNSLSSSYNTDDYYGYLDALDDRNDDFEVSSGGKLDIVTGRIPVKNAGEAKQVVDKILKYYSTDSFGSWKSKITLLGDDGQERDNQGLIQHLETSALKVEANQPNLNLEKLYTDAFKEEITSGGGRYPEIKRKFINAFNQGALVINYFGHGNVSALGEENFLDLSDVRSFRNLNNLPLFITVTCDFSRFDDPTIVSGGEELIGGALGGASAMITTTREISIFSGAAVNNKLADFLYSFDGKTRTIAEALKDVKNELNLSNELFVYFLGDPAMKLSIPKDGIVINSIQKQTTQLDAENNEVKVFENIAINGALNGLSRVRVRGEIQNEGAINTSYDGDLNVILFDKEIERKTLLNEEGGVNGSNQEDVVEFKSLENKVFVGKASINKGKFSFDFVLPKDVSVLPENAKFSLFATSSTQERIGSDFNYKVGGIDANAEEDTTPPTIQLFLEDESFVNGGSTSATPKLIAKINDENGINTSLNSIGHNISLVIDNDLANPISLNEFYTTEKNDFTQGIVRFELPELTLGNHTLSLKAWDSHNNSSTQTLQFVVEQDTGFALRNVLNYPNPFINYTEFWFQNNRQGDPLDVKIQIYTTSGKLIKTIHGFTDNSEDIERSITWDGKDNFGNKLGKGVYLFKLVAKNNVTQEITQKIEKLIIL